MINILALVCWRSRYFEGIFFMDWIRKEAPNTFCGLLVFPGSKRPELRCTLNLDYIVATSFYQHGCTVQDRALTLLRISLRVLSAEGWVWWNPTKTQGMEWLQLFLMMEFKCHVWLPLALQLSGRISEKRNTSRYIVYLSWFGSSPV